ncbi:putative helicase SRCAP-like [Apostichopus japonicus]|uniref:Putative helicase SRCAP-like n=2 Tax=Stichopus japonicus TaxID=307972 RepID=A0A2G8L754_STIJA|nr:putative helicase SRCAP-like [Apostichopus japonicus]
MKKLADNIMDPQDQMYQDSESPMMGSVLSERTDNGILRSDSPVEDDKGMYSCDKCQYKAKQRSNLMRHYYTMHADLADHLECCGQFYRTKGDFRQHVKTVHKQGYLCKICNRTFSRKALLKRHSYVHNGIREFKCEHCNYATSHKSNLERHFKVHTPLLRKRRCRLSYRISNGYQKHLTVEGRHVQSEPTGIDDNGCPNFLGLPSLPCHRYGMNTLPGSGHHWGKFPIAVDEPMARGAFPARTSLEDYESILKLQMMTRKQIDVRRNSSFPSSELAVLQNLSTAAQKHVAPLIGHHPPAPPSHHESLQNRLSQKDPPMFAPCEPNCFCAPKAMWMLPIYQGFLSHEIYAQLNSKSLNRSQPHTRLEHASHRGHFEVPPSMAHINADSASRAGNDERSIYLDLLKMQENVITSETPKQFNRDFTKKKTRHEETVIKAAEKEVTKSVMREKTTLVSEVIKKDHKVPQSDQPLKKRYKRFFIENIK